MVLIGWQHGALFLFSCVIHIKYVESRPKTISMPCDANNNTVWHSVPGAASIGGSKILQCEINYPGGQWVEHIIQWRKQGIEVPIFIQYNSYPPHVDAGYQGRIRLVEQASIEISDVRTTDEGWFECSIVFLGGNDDTDTNGTWVYLPVNFEATPLPNNCPPGHFQCNNLECVFETKKCDGSRDCEDGSDEVELNCGNSTCPEGYFRCVNSGWCIENNLVCDGANDCGDCSDEDRCTTTQPSTTLVPTTMTSPTPKCDTREFECDTDSGLCIHNDWVCMAITIALMLWMTSVV